MLNGLDKSLQERLGAIKLLMLDVDGVLTDGSIMIDDRGVETKIFNVKDGQWLRLLMKSGIDVVLATGRVSTSLEHRARDLGIAEVHQGVKNKVDVFIDTIQKRGLNPWEVAFIGDDIPDIALLKRVGFAATVADSTEVVRGYVHYITAAGGGKGAVKEVSELIIRAQGKWQTIAEEYEL